MSCVFCDIVSKEISANIIFEDENICCFLDIEPINEGHMLIIPKKHFLDIDEIPDCVIDEIMAFSKKIVDVIKEKYSPDGYSIMQNGGAFNDVGHYHLHVFPRYRGDGFGWTFSDKAFECSETLAQKIRELLNARL